MTGQRVEASPWATSRRRAAQLRDRYDFAAEPLTLYLALVEVWDESYEAAHADEPADLPGWAAEQVLPRIVTATVEHGPAPLANALKDPFEKLNVPKESFRALLAAWLAGEELVPVERYLARATLRGPLQAVDAGLACAEDPAPRGGRRCPRCGGPPQQSFRTDTGDRLVSGRRQLLCARCGDSWSFSSNTCAFCGGTQRTVHSEHGAGPTVGRRDDGDAMFGHLRVEACVSCSRYLVDVDLGRDPRAVPEVDELAALPLDLYAAERGLSKITPNLMGF